jgi:hypothetical protein
MRILYFDTETYSAVDLTKIGSYLYARHATTDLRCVSFCLIVDGARGPIETWTPGQPVPQAFIDVADDPNALVCAFNDAFDRQIQEQKLTRHYSWPVIPIERRRCAQAAVLSRALPASLDAAAAALGITTRKTAKGMAMMKRLAGPRRQSAKERKAGKPLDFSATPEELATLAEYNRADVLMMMEIIDRIGLLPPSEQAIWELDQHINERGVYVDVPLLENALSIGGEAKLELHAQMAELTGGTVTRPAQTQRMLKWLAERGCKLPNIRKPTVTDALLEPGLDAKARQLLELRQSSGGAAALKFATLRRWVDEQGEPRIRYAYRYHGGSAGRFTSLGCQLHNLRKPELEDVPGAIAAVMTRSLGEIRRRGFDRPLETIGHITRAGIKAKPGSRLFIADLSGVEARGAAHVCGARNELEQWHTFDHSGRPEEEPYYRTGLSTFGQPPETARKAGKIGSLWRAPAREHGAAICRDIFVEAMPRLETAGYPIVMHTHDEFVCEVADGQGSLEEFLAIITQSPSWAPDLPIAAKARISDRLIEIVEPLKAAAIIVDNTIDNTVAELEDEYEEEIEEELSESRLDLPMNELKLPSTPPLSPPPVSPAAETRICAQCRLDPPDGSERVSSYNKIYLHERCEEAFIKARMAEEGLAWSSLPDPPPAIVPSARREVMPEIKTRRPRASTIVACEKWPDGSRIFADVICCLGMH